MLLGSLTLLITPVLPAKTLIYAGTLIDGQTDTPRKNVTVVVSGERIEAVQDGFTAPAAGVTVIDLKSATVMPGLMDMHVHLTFEQAIPSATVEGAKLLGAEKDLGTVATGKFADLVAVPGDPLADIKLMTKVSFVMKVGTIYKQ